jgi:hypothetical protein
MTRANARTSVRDHDERGLVGGRGAGAHGARGSATEARWALRKGEHEAAIDLKAVPGIGAEVVLTVDGELRKTRLFGSHEQAELVVAIADTRATVEAKGWA